MAKFDFKSIMLGMAKRAATNTNLQQAAVGLLRGVAAQALKDKGVSEETRKMLHELGDGAETLVGAMVKNTPAETLVEPTIIPEPEKRDHAGGTTSSL